MIRLEAVAAPVIGAVTVGAPAIVTRVDAAIVNDLASRDGHVDDDAGPHRAGREPEPVVIDITRPVIPVAMHAVALVAGQHGDALVMAITGVAFVDADFDATGFRLITRYDETGNGKACGS